MLRVYDEKWYITVYNQKELDKVCLILSSLNVSVEDFKYMIFPSYIYKFEYSDKISSLIKYDHTFGSFITQHKEYTVQDLLKLEV